MKDKEIKVSFAEIKLKSDFGSLVAGKYQDKQLHKFISRAIDDLRINPVIF
ncbi:MAG: hypothetical protein MAG795_00681 [Candidatus Woesearchaeota archaeon]|nr:hypothetical protein [Candidatus Woesearchaeota archaeon]